MYFGRKTSKPDDKNAPMQTDCGGAIITQSAMTYGEADKIAASVDVTAIKGYADSHQHGFPSCYWKPKGGTFYYGEAMWLIYSYLAYNKIIDGDPRSYSNSKEYLYDLIIKRMEAVHLIEADADRRWFTWPEK